MGMVSWEPPRGSRRKALLEASAPPPADDRCFPRDGVSLACLRSFYEAHRALLEGLTTAQACHWVMMALSSGRRRAFTACLKECQGAQDAQGRPFVGPATVFASHAWSYEFGALVAALESYEASRSGSAPLYFWLANRDSAYRRRMTGGKLAGSL